MLQKLKNFFWGKGGFFDMGDRYPVLDKHFQSNIAGLFVVGDVAGTPDIKAGLNAGYDVAHFIAANCRFPKPSTGYAVVIIGGGPAGLNAAIELQKLGISYALFERKRLLAAIRAFDGALRLFYPTTGESSVRGDLWFGDTTAGELLDRWTPQIEALDLNVREHEGVASLTKKGGFVVTTSAAEYVADHVIVATGKLAFLKKLGVAEQIDSRVVYARIHEQRYAGKHILLDGFTPESVQCAVELSADNAVSIADPGAITHSSLYREHPVFESAVRRKDIAIYEHSRIERIEKESVVLRRELHERAAERQEEFSLENDLVFPFRGIERSLVDHLEADTAMIRKIGVKLENTWDWRRYAWLALAFIASAVFYYEKKTEYAAIGVGAMAGIAAFAAGGFYFLRGIMNGVEELRFGRMGKRSLRELLIGGAAAAAGAWAFAHRPLDIWSRSLGSWYPAIYSVLVVVFGLKAIFRWRDSIQTKKYIALIFFQVFFFWIFPEFIIRNWLSYTLVYAWPLVLAPHTITSFLDPHFDAGLFYFWWAVVLTVVIMPIFVALTGKKYCAWVCGCGGLAETVGDAFRHYSPKGRKNIERERSLYWVAGVAFVLTIAVGVMTLLRVDFTVAGIGVSDALQKLYSWGVDWALVAFIPVAMYPFFGGKIWCRYWCPTALYMHVLSRFFTKKRMGYFNIESDKERCIACNMCSRYCEVGIDVMRYALKGQVLDNTSSSCIGCGVCISVCPTNTLWFGEMRSGGVVQIRIPSL